MLAKRGEVLARLLAILEDESNPDFEGIETVAHNRGLLDNDALPAFVLLDGDESSILQSERRGRQGMSQALVKMTPEIFIILKIKLPDNKDIGEDLNKYRGFVVKAIANDADLIALLGANGGMSYDGCETDLKTGNTIKGEMLIHISLIAVVDPRT